MITPSPASSERDFDFMMGNHKVHHKKLKSRLAGSDEWIEFEGTEEFIPVLDGMGNIDRYFMVNLEGKKIEGMAIRFFNPQTRLWSIYWADSHRGVLDMPPVVGSFQNGKGYFYAQETFEDKIILVQFEWDITNREEPKWGQAFSEDGGRTWEWNWFMRFTTLEVG